MTASYTDIRPDILDFSPYSSGLAIEEIRERYGLPQVIKMASNENPLGVSPLVQKAIQKASSSAFRYPQAGNPRLSAALAAHHGIAAERIATGNGSDEIIDLLIRIKATPGTHTIVTSKPCFSIYTLQAKMAGIRLCQVPLNHDFSYNWQGLLAAVDESTALVFITAPDNPSGYCPDRAQLLDFARSLPPSALLVVDEAYMDFVDDEAAKSMIPVLSEAPNVAVLRTFSKSYGLAGLRIGYGIFPERVADYMHRVRLPFSVNTIAEEAAIAALADKTFWQETLRVVREGRDYLSRELAALGCQVQESQANFLLFRLPSSFGYTAQNVFEALLTRGIIIRPLKSYGLDDALRVSIGNATENKVFITALTKLLAQPGVPV